MPTISMSGWLHAGAEHHTADAAKAIDTNFDAHSKHSSISVAERHLVCAGVSAWERQTFRELSACCRQNRNRRWE